MDYSIGEMTYNISCFGELHPLKYFKQFTTYQNIQLSNKKSKDYRIEYTTPSIEIYSLKLCDTKIVDTIKGTSLEGQHLSGKNLIILGNINMSLILKYENTNKKCKRNKQKKNKVLNIMLPFSTFIVIPNYDSNEERINLRYFVEDVSVKLNQSKIFVSVTMLMQYLE